MKEFTGLLCTLYYLFSLVLGFAKFSFWFGLFNMFLPIAPFVYIVDKWL